jgi:hypothetical protein
MADRKETVQPEETHNLCIASMQPNSERDNE